MSYWISLHEPQTGELAEVENFQEGGTQAIGGDNKADLNVTYNYSKHFDFGGLNGQKAGNTIKMMQDAVNELGTKQDSNYWNPTKGNVGYAVNILLNWAKQYPNYMWEVN